MTRRQGEEKPYPSHAEQWRDYYGKDVAWLYDPWTGVRRSACDVGSDLHGYLIVTGENVIVEKEDKQPENKQHEALVVSEEILERITDTFMRVRLPNDFSPDGGIAFRPPANPINWPTGTNLFSYDQFIRMIRWVNDVT